MTPGQQTLLIAVDSLDAADFADLDFVTELTTRIQRRVFAARSLKPTIPVPTTRLKPSQPKRVSPFEPVKQTTLISKLTRAHLPAHVPPAAWPFPPPKSELKHYDEKVEKWVMNNVTLGSIVKMKDTRDGHGFRCVTLFNFGDTTLNCTRLVEINPAELADYRNEKIFIINEPGVPHLQYFRLTNFPTKHGMAKVVATVTPRGGLNNSHLVQKLPAL